MGLLNQASKNNPADPGFKFKTDPVEPETPAAPVVSDPLPTNNAPGLTSGDINQADPFSDIKGYNEERVEIAPEDTVEGRVQGIINRGGPALQSEVTRSQQAANSKGLLNTSMAVGAGERARIDTALPIASQDSSQSLQAGLSNQAEFGKANQFTAGELNTAGQQQRAGQQQLEAIDAQGKIDIQKQQAQNQFTTAENLRLAGYDTDTAATLAGVNETTDFRLADIQSTRDTVLHINDLDTLTEEQKNTVFNNAVGYMHDYNLENISQENRVEIEGIRADNAELLQSSVNASNLMSNYTLKVGDILSNPDISITNKDALIAKENDALELSFAVVDGISSGDWSDLLDFSGGQDDPGAVPPVTGGGATGGGAADTGYEPTRVDRVALRDEIQAIEAGPETVDGKSKEERRVAAMNTYSAL